LDYRLLAWGLRGKPAPVPRLWLFTDDRRLPDPLQAVAALPRGRAGVVLRHDADGTRAALGQELARICRSRRLVLVVAGDVRLAAALNAGIHLRGGRWPSVIRRRCLLTSSSHSVPELRRAAAAGAAVAFLSPAFPTASHRGAPGLGPLRWGIMAGRVRRAASTMQIGALGGIDGYSINRMPRLCHMVGAITALSP
jgi:thiamine-phosphate pyrophosphorylase